MKNNLFFLLAVMMLITNLAYCGGPTPLQSAVSNFWAEFGSDAVYTVKNVGIGTSTPDVTKALHVVGDSRVDGNVDCSGIVYTTKLYSLSSLTLAATSLNLPNNSIGKYFYSSVVSGATVPAYSSSLDTNTGIFFPAADTVAISNNGIETMRTTADNNLEITGFTKLGDAATGIKMKVLTGTTSTGSLTLAHGLTSSKIISMTGVVFAVAGEGVTPNSNISTYEYSLEFNTVNANITVYGASVQSKPFVITILYTE